MSERDNDYEDDRKSRRSQVPSAPSTERSVLGFVLRGKPSATTWWNHVTSVAGMESLDELFYDSAHRVIASVMSSLIDRDDEITENILADRVISKGWSEIGPDGDEPADFIADLSLDTALSTAEELDRSVGILKETARRRSMISALEEQREALFDVDTSLAEISSNLTQAAEEALSAGTKKLPGFTSIYEEVMETETPRYTVPTGFPTVDSAMGGGSNIEGMEAPGGLGSGRTYVIAAGSGVGKTTTMFRMAREAMDHDTIPIIMSLESSREDILAKLISGASNAPFKEVLRSLEMQDRDFKAVTDDEDRKAVFEAMESLSDEDGISRVKVITANQILNGIHDIPSLVMSVREENKSRAKECKCVVFIDYLQLLVNNAEKTQTQLSDITRSLHLMAQHLSIPIVMLSQFTKMEPGQRPRKENLFGSSTINNNADGIILMWRPGQMENAEDSDTADSYNEAEYDENVMLMDLAKNRIGQNIVVHAILEHSRSIVEEDSEQPLDTPPQRGRDSDASASSTETTSRRSERRSQRSKTTSMDSGVDTTPEPSRRSRGGAKRASSRRRNRGGALEEVT